MAYILTRSNNWLELELINIEWFYFFPVHNRYELISDCWKEDPNIRPSFYRLIEKLEAIMERDAPYLNVNKHNEDRPYYNVPPEASAD